MDNHYLEALLWGTAIVSGGAVGVTCFAYGLRTFFSERYQSEFNRTITGKEKSPGENLMVRQRGGLVQDVDGKYVMKTWLVPSSLNKS